MNKYYKEKLIAFFGFFNELYEEHARPEEWAEDVPEELFLDLAHFSMKFSQLHVESERLLRKLQTTEDTSVEGIVEGLSSNIQKSQEALARLVSVLSDKGVSLEMKKDVPYFYSKEGKIVQVLNGKESTGSLVNGRFVQDTTDQTCSECLTDILWENICGIRTFTEVEDGRVCGTRCNCGFFLRREDGTKL